ncbi:MAG: MerR family transcriptional regulator [Planctomycetaceae bacterium]|nr:MerR family transcriptional regulator [Planctomycetales bacterium]MCB9925292.1 MerR family transcriptional regulator [Planctomycetaceae bacterium]
MGNDFTIGQLAKAADIPTSTLRYYERIGLLQPRNRSEGNYRLYDEGDLERVRFIRAAQSTGFTLDDVTALLNLRVAANARCEDIQVLMEERLTDVKARMKDLRHVERVLKSFLAKCRESNRRGHCAVIEELNAASIVKSRGASHRSQRDSDREVAKALRASNFPRRLGADKTRLRIEVLRLVAKGRPVSVRKVEQIASQLGMPLDAATSFISKVSERDAEGNILGILGLSQRAHPHRFELKDRVLSTWCAWDALFLPALLKQPATVESSCPVTKERIRLKVTPKKVEEVAPADCVVTIAVPATSPEAVEEIWAAFCHFVLFFASEEAASRWVSKRKQDLRILSVEEAYNLGRRAFPG